MLLENERIFARVIERYTYIGSGRIRMTSTKNEVPVIQCVAQISQCKLGAASGMFEQTKIELQANKVSTIHIRRLSPVVYLHKCEAFRGGQRHRFFQKR
jgi:hypothetical protein